MPKEPRVVVWFSCGASSAVAAKLAIQEYGDRCVVAYCDPGGEHPSNKKFLKDVEEWIGQEIIVLRNTKGYKDHFDVFRKTKYINGIQGARCTIELKKKCRFEFQLADDIHIFGYTAEEKKRAKKFNHHNHELTTDWILIRKEVSKGDCLGVLWKARIDIPILYDLGYNHNNCIMCPKGGKGYANKIRVDFPEHFQEMALIEREIGHSIFRNEEDGSRIYLDELDPKAGNFATEPPISCGIGCGIISQELGNEEKA
jgi:3'-phosphoadenosine 5'-phosphosulfate sulfotransferase (PAPS reductase)/FAD synthetase|tara:strand:+ start:427 stop:1194 length:768 start_codon:yes stop_codon:yes gene_type:complete